MNKDEIVRLIYNQVNDKLMGQRSYITLADANSIYDDIITSLSGSILEGSTVRVPGLGKFYTSTTPARTIQHPRIPDQQLEVSATRQLRFKAYPSMKDKLNGRA